MDLVYLALNAKNDVGERFDFGSYRFDRPVNE